MKKILMVLTAVLILAGSAHAVQVAFYMGKATIIRNGKSIPVKTGLEVKSGDIIQTGPQGLVELVYNDNSRVIVREKSRVRIGTQSIHDSENPALILGVVTGKFQKIMKGSHKIYTPTAICAVRGTEYDVAVSSTGDTRVSVTEGTVDVNNSEGSVQLSKGEDAEADVSEKPDKEEREKLSEWLTEKDKELEKEPDDSVKSFKKQVQIIDMHTEKREEDIKKLEKQVAGADNEDEIKEAGLALDDAEDLTEDDIMLTETMSDALSVIASNFKKRKIKIYRDFEKVKKESDKVLEVQKQSYADIQAIKDDYVKTREKIMGDFKKESDKLLDNKDIDNVKPEIKKYDVK